ncbi:MAG: SDR family oxidoreductase [Spirochaetales bacterium]|nr:SDR family oxidoreductase [Spirochaetales bacterium]
MKSIIVTGGAGFIGAHLCRRILERGDAVLCVDNFSTSSREGIDDLLQHSRFSLLEHDVCIPFEAEGDALFNLASPASPVFYQKDPVQTMKTNILGSLHVLELARQQNIPVLQASTSEVYGDPLESPQTESYWGHVNPVGLRSCYDEGKRSAECLFFDYSRQYAVPVKVVRLFNTYGPGMLPRDGRVITNFIIQALKGEDLTVYGRGTQTRSFCYVDDTVDGLLRFMDTPESCTGPINLGRAEEISMLNLALLVKEMTDSSSPIVFRDLPEDDPRQRRPDLSLAQEVLNWNPSVNLRSGLQKTINFVKNIHPR